MKKAKLLFKVDRNDRGKLYVGGKWLKDIAQVQLYGEPWEYILMVNVYKRGKDGRYIVENNEIAIEVRDFKIGGRPQPYSVSKRVRPLIYKGEK